MDFRWGILRLLFVALVSSGFAIPKPGDRKDRVIEQKLSNEEHYFQDSHNVDYDHDAFIGDDEAEEFDHLPPEESIERLGKIVDKIDVDSDGFVTEEELQAWIKYIREKSTKEDTEKQWKEYSEDNKVTWENYMHNTYGTFNDVDSESFIGRSENDDVDKEMIKRDERRWKKADADNDNVLNKEEFSRFLHPEEYTSMQEIVIQETLEDIDQDGDGKISLDEFIGDLYMSEDDKAEPPAWVLNEKEQFAKFRDEDGDGYLNFNEVKNWIFPVDYDHSASEARHLIYESDTDQDKKLSKKEILDNHEVFVGSQATNFGEVLSRHDEF